MILKPYSILRGYQVARLFKEQARLTKHSAKATSRYLKKKYRQYHNYYNHNRYFIYADLNKPTTHGTNMINQAEQRSNAVAIHRALHPEDDFDNYGKQIAKIDNTTIINHHMKVTTPKSSTKIYKACTFKISFADRARTNMDLQRQIALTNQMHSNNFKDRVNLHLINSSIDTINSIEASEGNYRIDKHGNHVHINQTKHLQAYPKAKQQLKRFELANLKYGTQIIQCMNSHNFWQTYDRLHINQPFVRHHQVQSKQVAKEKVKMRNYDSYSVHRDFSSILTKPKSKQQKHYQTNMLQQAKEALKNITMHPDGSITKGNHSTPHKYYSYADEKKQFMQSNRNFTNHSNYQNKRKQYEANHKKHIQHKTVNQSRAKLRQHHNFGLEL